MDNNPIKLAGTSASLGNHCWAQIIVFEVDNPTGSSVGFLLWSSHNLVDFL